MKNRATRTRYIFVTGGVCSGLGKGTAAASIGAILKAAGFRVFSIKFDPYLNVDPGTMNPYQHGEVFVLDDGTETDLDLGHYERFLDERLSKLSNLTTGQVYQRILNAERGGKFLGKTIQIIPHITEAILGVIAEATRKTRPDFLIMEIGGTVGDIEGEPYLETARQLHREAGDDRVLFVHVALLPYLGTSRELKTKPAQASVRELRRIGIQPDVLLCRADEPIRKEHLEKLSLFCDVPLDAVIPAPTITSIYEVPLNLEQHGISRIIFRKFGLPYRRPNLRPWRQLLTRIQDGHETVRIAIVGKYTDHGDAYLSVQEALKAAVYDQRAKLDIEWIDAELLEKRDTEEWRRLRSCEGIIVPGGFGRRGVEGKILAARHARVERVPYFGLCLGMQIATIEFARSVLRLKEASSTEFNARTKHPVIHIMPEQEKKLLRHEYGATMRLGSWPCKLHRRSLSYAAYRSERIVERHRHRYELNNAYRKRLEQAGLRIAGTTPDGVLVEIVELANHPWFVGVQFHPEFTSRPLRPHPLFRAFIRASLAQKRKQKPAGRVPAQKRRLRKRRINR